MSSRSAALHKVLISAILTFLVTKAAASDCPRASKCVKSLDRGETCPLFPMVHGSIAAPPGPKGFILRCLRPYVYFFSDGAYQATIAYSRHYRHLVVVDFPRSANSFNRTGVPHLITAAASVVGSAQPHHISLVYSHHHLDHIGAAGAFHDFVKSAFPNASLDIWSTKQAKEILLRNSPPKAPIPTSFISSSMVRLKISQEVNLEISVLPAHSKSDVLVYVPPSAAGDDGILHFVDVVSPREAPFSGFTFAIDLHQFLEAHNVLLKKRFNYFISGHGILGNKQDVAINLSYTKFVLQSIQKAAQNTNPQEVKNILARVQDPDDAAFGNGVWSFISIINLQIEACVRDTILAWGCRLSAVDVFAESHCRTAAFYVLVDQ